MGQGSETRKEKSDIGVRSRRDARKPATRTLPDEDELRARPELGEEPELARPEVARLQTPDDRHGTPAPLEPDGFRAWGLALGEAHLDAKPPARVRGNARDERRFRGELRLGFGERPPGESEGVPRQDHGERVPFAQRAEQEALPRRADDQLVRAREIARA